MYAEKHKGYALANLGNRLVALIIDNVLTGLVVGLFGINDSWGTGAILGFIVGGLYQGFFLTQWDGQTPGKRLLGVRVIKTDGSELTGVDAFVRYAGYYLNSFVLGLGWLWALFDPQHRGWHDYLDSTVVVEA